MRKRIWMIKEQSRRTAMASLLLGAACIGLVGCTSGSAVRQKEEAVGEDASVQVIGSEAQQTGTDTAAEEETGAWDQMQDQDGMLYQEILLYAEREKDKVCIELEPSVLRSRQSYHYIPTGEQQEQLKALIGDLDLEQSPVFEGWAGRKESGWRLWYQDLELTAFADGSFLTYRYDESSGTGYLIEDQELYELVCTMLEESVGYRPFDPADIKDIVSAKMDLCGPFTDQVAYSQTITDPETLAVFEDLFGNASYIFGGADCGNDYACLELSLADGQVVRLSVAVDSCTNFGINGVYYDYRPERERETGGWHSYDFFSYFDGLSDKLP